MGDRWLHAVYAIHNPSKLGKIDTLRDEYHGRELELARRVAQKYRLQDPPSGTELGSIPELGNLARTESPSRTKIGRSTDDLESWGKDCEGIRCFVQTSTNAA